MLKSVVPATSCYKDSTSFEVLRYTLTDRKEHFAPSNPPILLNNKSKMNMKAIFELRLNIS